MILRVDLSWSEHMNGSHPRASDSERLDAYLPFQDAHGSTISPITVDRNESLAQQEAQRKSRFLFYKERRRCRPPSGNLIPEVLSKKHLCPLISEKLPVMDRHCALTICKNP